MYRGATMCYLKYCKLSAIANRSTHSRCLLAALPGSPWSVVSGPPTGYHRPLHSHLHQLLTRIPVPLVMPALWGGPGPAGTNCLLTLSIHRCYAMFTSNCCNTPLKQMSANIHRTTWRLAMNFTEDDVEAGCRTSVLTLIAKSWKGCLHIYEYTSTFLFISLPNHWSRPCLGNEQGHLKVAKDAKRSNQELECSESSHE